MNKQQAIEFTADWFITSQLGAAALVFLYQRPDQPNKILQQAAGVSYLYKKHIEAWEVFCTELDCDPIQLLHGRHGADFFAISDPAISNIAPLYGNAAPLFPEAFGGQPVRSVEELKADLHAQYDKWLAWTPD